MTDKEIQELKERIYNISYSGFLLDSFFNDIEKIDNQRFNKDLAYKALKLIVDEIYKLKDKAKKYDEKETILPLKTEINEHNTIDELCPICNNSIQEWDKYCSKCGQRVR